MSLGDFSVKRPVAITMVVLALLILGGMSFTKLTVDLYPKMDLPYAAVMVNYTGASPEEVESSVAKPIEQAMGTVNNIESITTTVQAGSAFIGLQFTQGTNMDFAALQMREKIDRVKNALPDGVDNPMVLKMDPGMLPILEYGISGADNPAELRRLVDEKIANRIERLSGVASVGTDGGWEREIQVDVDPNKLAGFGLSLSQINQALAGENMNVSGGQVADGKMEYTITTVGQIKTLEELGAIPLATPTGGTISLKDIAEVKDTYKDIQSFGRINGQPTVNMTILKQTDANTVQVVDKIKAEMEKLKKELPQNVTITEVMDQSVFIKRSLDTVVNDTVLGGLFSILVLYIFLRNFRSTLIISVAIPFAIITTFCMLYFGKLTLNLMSLGGLALGVGHMVDYAIVVLESIYRYHKNGYGAVEAAIEGTREVAMAVTASALTVAAVFLPIVFVEGIAGQFFKQFALTVAFSQLAALAVSLTLIPMMSSKFLYLVEGKETTKKRWYIRFGDKMSAAIEGLDLRYRHALEWALKHRKTVIIVVFVGMVASVGGAVLVGAEFMPKTDTGQFTVDIQLPRGTALEETDKLTKQIEDYVQGLPGVEHVLVAVGTSANIMDLGNQRTEQSQLVVRMVPQAERNFKTENIVNQVRDYLAGIPGATLKVTETDPMPTGPMGGSPIQVQIKGDDLDVLKDLANQAITRIKEVPGALDVTSGLTEGRPEVQIQVDKDRAATYGFSTSQVANAAKAAIQGTVPTRFRSGGKEVDIRVALPEGTKKDLRELEQLLLTSPSGAQVPLGDLAKVAIAIGPNTINRDGQARVVSITGELGSGWDLQSVMNNIKIQLADMPIPPGYTLSYEGQDKEMMDSFKSLGVALILAIFLVYMVMAGQFESLLYPFIIMFSVPVSFIGVVLGLLLSGRHFSVPAFIGIIMMIGIVVNNAIVLVDYINTLRKRGMDRKTAILQAGPVRLRPILMTALATILALIPLTLGIGEGAESQAPMATVVVGGLTVSTAITLLLVPVVYTIFDDWGTRLRNRIRRRITGEENAAL